MQLYSFQNNIKYIVEKINICGYMYKAYTDTMQWRNCVMASGNKFGQKKI